ncbi:Hypp1954 [Branchiostoma lanceolatum]|uniref:Hypp1954 protein n=1 Tax=Branchiostoma lanceolatum TaxID=7740 RepID=A0A8J9ZPP0_BRALA|nr:Hypp1954 [Branchiostoma lanceolatum]
MDPIAVEDQTTEQPRPLRRSMDVRQPSRRHKQSTFFQKASDKLLLEERISSLGYERDQVPGDAQMLRQDLVEYIKSQADFYIPFLVDGPQAFWQQLERLSVEGQWSSDLADALPHALANFTSRRVTLITSKPNQPTISIEPDADGANESGTSVVLSYFARRGTEHYDAVIRKSCEDNVIHTTAM